MQSFSRGWNFLLQAWKMAMADKDLLKPSLYALIVGFIVSLIGIIPMVISALVLGTDSLAGQMIMGLFGVLLVFAQYSVTYIFSAMTVKLIYDYLTNGDGRMDQPTGLDARSGRPLGRGGSSLDRALATRRGGRS